jgi:hypothetical protein
MMCFGWRPIQSCYRRVGDQSTCPSTVWFWVLAAAAVVGGLAQKK